MLNEPVQESSQGGGGGGSGGGDGGGGDDTEGVSEAGNGHMNYIQLTLQEKEAIERVSLSPLKCYMAAALDSKVCA